MQFPTPPVHSPCSARLEYGESNEVLRQPTPRLSVVSEQSEPSPSSLRQTEEPAQTTLLKPIQDENSGMTSKMQGQGSSSSKRTLNRTSGCSSISSVGFLNLRQFLECNWLIWAYLFDVYNAVRHDSWTGEPASIGAVQAGEPQPRQPLRPLALVQSHRASMETSSSSSVSEAVSKLNGRSSSVDFTANGGLWREPASKVVVSASFCLVPMVGRLVVVADRHTAASGEKAKASTLRQRHRREWRECACSTQVFFISFRLSGLSSLGLV